MKRVKIVVGVIIIIIAAFAYAHIGKVNLVYNKSVDNSEYIGTGVFEGTVEESFVCVEDTLDGITAKCQLQGDAAGTGIKMTLIDEELDKKVAEAELTAEEIDNSKFNEFTFNTLQNCRGKTFRVVFKNINESIKDTKGIGLLYQPETENNTQLSINGEKIEGTLIIKTVTDRFDLETFCVFLLFVLYIVFFIKFLYKLFR